MCQLSDEIDLQDRWQVLHKRLLNQQSTSLRKASSTAKGSRKSSTVLVVDTEALPENISEELDVLAMLLTALNPPSTTSNKMVAKLGKQQHGEEKSRNQLMTMLSLLLHQLLPKISLPVEALDEKQNNGSGAISVFSSSTKPRQQLPDPAPSCHKDTHTNSNTKMATPMSSKSTWICHICTFLNTKKALLTKFSKHQCVMCQAVYSEEVPTVSTVEVLKIKASPTPKKSDVIDLLESSEDEVEEVKKTEVTPLVNSNPANNATCKEPIAWRYRDVLKCLKSDSAVILSPSELPLSKSNVSKKKDDDLLTACFKVLGSNQDLTADSINLQSFTIHGRRFGDPKRKGKNKFCGIHDELLFVEDLVMQKCRIFDHDESKSLDSVFQIKDVEGEVVEVEDEINSHDEVQAGGTAQLKDFQTVHYQEVINEDAGWQGWHCEGGILRTLFGVCMWDVLFADLPHVFLTAYQDLPLDFPYPSFYFSR